MEGLAGRSHIDSPTVSAAAAAAAACGGVGVDETIQPDVEWGGRLELRQVGMRRGVCLISMTGEGNDVHKVN